ncbi:MAG: hypothetical protein GY694_08850 [Gammaproteobacteria bacterium]|nr:hypothetical protein [Gammaproteobacteria bacterium]
MSNSIHMTVKQAVRESGYSYGSPEFRQYMFEHNIELLAQKGKLKIKSREKRKADELFKSND